MRISTISNLRSTRVNQQRASVFKRSAIFALTTDAKTGQIWGGSDHTPQFGYKILQRRAQHFSCASRHRSSVSQLSSHRIRQWRASCEWLCERNRRAPRRIVLSLRVCLVAYGLASAWSDPSKGKFARSPASRRISSNDIDRDSAISNRYNNNQNIHNAYIVGLIVWAYVIVCVCVCWRARLKAREQSLWRCALEQRVA